MVTGAHVGLTLLLGNSEGAAPPPVDPQRPFVSWPRLEGTGRPGETATVIPAGLTGIQSYQWFLDEQAINGATSSNYVPTAPGLLSCCIESNEGKFTTPILQVVHSHNHSAHHVMMEDMALDVAPHVNATHIAIQDGRWSDPLTWDLGEVPGEGAIVLVPLGVDVTYDITASPRIDRLRLDGALRAALDQSSQLHVETIVIAHSGLLEIGASFEERLPENFNFEVLISDRAYTTNSGAATDLDLVNDPFLMGRGIICLGTFIVFGAKRKRYIKTADDAAPLIGDTSLTLADAPINWSIGDEIIVPGTAVEVANGATTLFDERRTITGISGNSVSFSEPLNFNHDHQNSAVSRTDLQPTIANVTTNVSVRSESAGTPHRRGHIMIMHEGFSDVWDLGCIDLGRTDTSGEPGNVLPGGQFEYFDEATDNLETTTLTPDANSKGRYPFHFHICGFGRAEVPNLHNSVIDGTPGWGVVHHACEADIFDNVVFNFVGAGMVAEQGNETGPWVRNFVFGCVNQSNADYRAVKVVDGGRRGLRGDFGRHGVGYYFRGRAVRTVDNIAASCTTGYVFFHREQVTENLSPHLPIDRETTDVKDINNTRRAFIDVIRVPDHPISHFTRNEAFGVYNGLSISKASPDQGHDLMSQIVDFRTWAVQRGVNIEYVGAYLVVGTDAVSTGFIGTDYISGQNYGIINAANTVQVTTSLSKVEGFDVGVRMNGDSVGNVNADFSMDDPRFIIDRVTYINCATDLLLSTSSGQATLTEDVTVVYTDATPPLLADKPTTTVPFIVGDWDGNAALGASPNPVTNLNPGFKQDSVSNFQPIPKTWDDMQIHSRNYSGFELRQYFNEYGYWTFGGEDILVTWQYYSDRITGRPIRTAHAWRITGSHTNRTAGVAPNGEWPVATASSLNVSDILVTSQPGEAATIDVAAKASEQHGSPLSLAHVPEGPVYLGPASGRLVVNVETGKVTYKPDFGFSGSDQFFVWVTDGTGIYETVKISINAATVPIVLSFGQSNTPYGPYVLNRFSDTGLTVAAEIATAVGGTSVAPPSGGWNLETGDGSDSPGQNYLDAIAAIDAHLTANPTHYIAAMYASQGEAATGPSQWYANNGFRDANILLIQSLREHIGYTVPFFQFTLSDWQTARLDMDVQAVRAQQFDIENFLPEVYTIDTDAVFAASGISIFDAMRSEGRALAADRTDIHGAGEGFIHYRTVADASSPSGQIDRIYALANLPEFRAAFSGN